MVNITRPLDAAAALTLNQISAWAANELAERIAAKQRQATVGYSNASCSTYVDVLDAGCVRISDHDAMSYNRTGDFNIFLARGNRAGNAHEIVRLTALYSVTETVVVDWDDDGEPCGWETGAATLTENEDADDAEFEGWQVDIDALTAAIDRAETFLARAIDA